MGRVARKAGALDDKTGNLIQLAACATEDELYQTIALLVNVIEKKK